MKEQLTPQRELPPNYKERSLLRDRIRESIPECPELEFKFIFGRHLDESDAEFSAENFADSDIVLIEGIGHELVNFNGLMEDWEKSRRNPDNSLGVLALFSDFPSFTAHLLQQAYNKGKIIRSADISSLEATDLDYMASERDIFADRIKSEKLPFDKVVTEMKAWIELDLESQLFREKNIDRNMEGVIIEVLNSHKELLSKNPLKISINIGALHSSLAQGFEIRRENSKSVLQKGVLPNTIPLDIAYNYLLYTGRIPDELLIQCSLYIILVRYLDIDDAPQATLNMLRKVSDDEDLTARIYNIFLTEDAPAEKLREIVNSI